MNRLTISGGSISSNNANDNGGGIYSQYLEVDISGGQINANSTSANGGGIYMEGVDYSDTGIMDWDEVNEEWIKFFEHEHEWYLENGYIFNGTYYVKYISPELTISNCELSQNSAVHDGGGIYSFNLENVTINENVSFSQNVSGAPVYWDITDPGYADYKYKILHDQKISAATTFTIPYNNAYSNDDIVFESDVFKIHYHANGGTGNMSSSLALNGTATVSENGFTAPSGKTFAKWNTKADATGTSYAPGDEITVDTDITLYAQWAPEGYPYRIEYYRGSVTADNLIDTVIGNVFFSEGHQLTAEDVVTDLGENWLNAKRPASGYNSGIVHEGYPVISAVVENNAVRVLYTPASTTTYYTVTVKYHESGGNVIAEQKNDAAAQGSAYSISAHDIAGYRYVETVVNGAESVNRDVSIPSVSGDYVIIFRYDYDRPILERVNHHWYVRGYPDNSIKPDGNITRAEMAMIFYRLMTNVDKEAKEPRPVFEDTPTDAWYAKAVTYLYDYGIVNGYEDGKFRPDAFISRAEIAKMAGMFDNLDAPVESTFPDVPSTHWAYSYIDPATRKGWLQEYEDRTFRPDYHITRAEMVTLVNKVLNRQVKPENILAGVHMWDDLQTTHWAYSDIMEAAHSHMYERLDDTDFEIWTSITGTGLNAPSNE